MEIPAIPGSDAGFPVTLAVLLDPVAPAKHHISVGIAAAAGRLKLRNRLLDRQRSRQGGIRQIRSQRLIRDAAATGQRSRQ